MESKLVMFMSGMLNIIAEFISRDGEKVTVRNPMSCMFNVIDKKLNFELVPIVFNACIEHGDNVWTFRMDGSLNFDVDFKQELHDIYNNMVLYTSPANVSAIKEEEPNTPEVVIP